MSITTSAYTIHCDCNLSGGNCNDCARTLEISASDDVNQVIAAEGWAFGSSEDTGIQKHYCGPCAARIRGKTPAVLP